MSVHLLFAILSYLLEVDTCVKDSQPIFSGFALFWDFQAWLGHSRMHGLWSRNLAAKAGKERESMFYIRCNQGVFIFIVCLCVVYEACCKCKGFCKTLVQMIHESTKERRQLHAYCTFGVKSRSYPTRRCTAVSYFQLSRRTVLVAGYNVAESLGAHNLLHRCATCDHKRPL